MPTIAYGKVMNFLLFFFLFYILFNWSAIDVDLNPSLNNCMLYPQCG